MILNNNKLRHLEIQNKNGLKMKNKIKLQIIAGTQLKNKVWNNYNNMTLEKMITC